MGLSTASIRKDVDAFSGYDTVNKTYDYIYYGTWRDTPIKWRVLDTRANTGDVGAMFLMTDDCLYPLPGVLYNCYIQFNPGNMTDTFGRTVICRNGIKKHFIPELLLMPNVAGFLP